MQIFSHKIKKGTDRQTLHKLIIWAQYFNQDVAQRNCNDMKNNDEICDIIYTGKKTIIHYDSSNLNQMPSIYIMLILVRTQNTDSTCFMHSAV